MNTTLPTMSLGLLGGAFTDAVGTGQNPGALGGLTADVKGAFDGTLKSALEDAGDMREAADAREARDSAEETGVGATNFQPPAHLLAALVNAPPPELGNAANEAPPISAKPGDLIAGTAGATGASGGAGPTLGRAEFTQELTSAGDAVGPGGGAKGIAIPGSMTAASGTYDLPLPQVEGGDAKSAGAEAVSPSFDPLKGLGAAPAAEGAPMASTSAWTGADFGPKGVISGTSTVGSTTLAADGFAPHSPTVSATAMTNALGDGSFANHIIGAKTAAAENKAALDAKAAPEVVAATPEVAATPDTAKPATAQPVALGPAKPATAPTAPTAKSVKSVAGRSTKPELSEKADDDEDVKKSASSLGSTTTNEPAAKPILPDALTPTPNAHAPKAHEPSVKTMTAQEATPTAPSDSAQEAVRVAETVGHKRFLASGEARGHINVEGLGRIEVRAHTEQVGPVGAAVQVSVQVDDAQARAVVQQHASDLRAHVQAEVPNANVHLDGRNAGSASNHGQSSNSGSSHDRGHGSSRGSDDSAQGPSDGAVQRQVSGRKGAARYVL